MGSRATAEQFERRLWFRPISHAVEINEDGLVLGAGTILARMGVDPSGAQILAFDEDQPRLFALLAAAYGRSAPSDLPIHLESAARFWKRGDKALANIRLAFARLPRLDDTPGDRAGAYRLFLAENLLEDGMSPEALMKVLGVDGPQADLRQISIPPSPAFLPEAGRPAGNGPRPTPRGGNRPRKKRKGRRDGGAGSFASTLAAPGTLAEGLFGAEDSEFLAGLAVLATKSQAAPCSEAPAAALGAASFCPVKAWSRKERSLAIQTCAIR